MGESLMTCTKIVNVQISNYGNDHRYCIFTTETTDLVTIKKKFRNNHGEIFDIFLQKR